MIRVLFLGEIVGRPGIATLKKELATLKKDFDIDYTIANAEGCSNGFGLGVAHSIQLSKLGIDLLTGGEKIFYKPDMVEFINKSSFILRPMNFPPASPGKCFKNVNIKGKDFLIINIIGESGLTRLSVNNPFVAIDSFLKKISNETVVLVCFHAAMSAEKATMMHYLEGRVSSVIGTHTKVLSADAKITDKSTAYITDIGRVGSLMSVGGLDPDIEINKFKSQIPTRSKECWRDCVLQGVVVDIDEISGKTVGITPINKRVNVKEPRER